MPGRLSIYDDKSFKNTIQSFESAHETSKRNPRIWWIAASFIGILLITYFFSFNQSSTEALFAENFEPYRNVIQPIVRGESDNTLITSAFISYENKEYEKAIYSFSLLVEVEKKWYATFYLANSYLAIENSEKAIPLLQDYIKNEGEFKEKASWYLALAYLKENNIDSSINILKKIVALKAYNYEKAALLLKDLK